VLVLAMIGAGLGLWQYRHILFAPQTPATVPHALSAAPLVADGWLGVRFQPVTPAIAASHGLHDTRGAMVVNVAAGGPAAHAGLKQGDVVLSFDGNEVKEMRDLPRLVANAARGSIATLNVWRDGRSIDLHATLDFIPENPDEKPAGW
jgi:serine protease Do